MPNPLPFAPPAWQLPHLRSLKPGERRLLVVLAEPQPSPGFLARGVVGVVPDMDGVRWFMADGMSELVKCPLGPVGSIIRIEGVGDFRNAAVDLRRTDTMTEEEALAWGCPVYQIAWELDHPQHPWGAWAWFVGAERMEHGS